MRDELLAALWLCGPPGAGKSAVGGALYAGRSRSGARAGFADIDQLGMCLPAPPDEDLGTSPGLSSGTIPGASLTICRLRASPDELRRRLTSRREGPDFVAGALRQAQDLDRTSFADACAATDGLTVAEVARLVRERCDGHRSARLRVLSRWPSGSSAGSGLMKPI